MKESTKKAIYWLPRALAVTLVLFGIFLSWISKQSTIVIVAVIFLAATIIAWKWEKIGAAIFIILGMLPIVFITVVAGGDAPGIGALWRYLLFLEGPFILTGVLFWISAMTKK